MATIRPLGPGHESRLPQRPQQPSCPLVFPTLRVAPNRIDRKRAGRTRRAGRGEQVDLSDNGLGPELGNMSGCRGLVSLRLGRNRFEGPLPLGMLVPAAKTLLELDLSENAFEGSSVNLPVRICTYICITTCKYIHAIVSCE